MNFDFSDDLKAAARAGAADSCASAVRRRPCAASWKGPSPTTRRCGRRSPRWAGSARRSPKSTAAPASAIWACACWPRSWARRWRRCRSPPRSISPARRSSPPAARRRRRRWLPKLAAGEVIGTLALAEGPGKADVAQAAHHLPRRHAQRREAAGARRRCRRLRHRRRAGRARRSSLALVDLKASGVTRAAVDDHRSEPLARAHRLRQHAGRGARRARRGRSPAAARAGPRRRAVRVRAGRRRAAVARDGARLRAASATPSAGPIGSFQAIKHKLADVYVATELARSNAYYGAWALARDAAGAAAGRRRRAHLGERGLLPGGEGEHPDAWRHGLHLGGRLPPLLPPRQAARAGARQHAGLEGSAGRPARDAPTRHC